MARSKNPHEMSVQAATVRCAAVAFSLFVLVQGLSKIITLDLYILETNKNKDTEDESKKEKKKKKERSPKKKGKKERKTNIQNNVQRNLQRGGQKN